MKLRKETQTTGEKSRQRLVRRESMVKKMALCKSLDFMEHIAHSDRFIRLSAVKINETDV